MFILSIASHHVNNSTDMCHYFKIRIVTQIRWRSSTEEIDEIDQVLKIVGLKEIHLLFFLTTRDYVPLNPLGGISVLTRLQNSVLF